MHPIVANLLGLATSAPAVRQGFRRTPHKNSIVNVKDKLEAGYEARLKELGSEPLPVVYNEGHPYPKFDEVSSLKEFVEQSDKRRLGGYEPLVRINPDTGKLEGPQVADRFSFNPNADASILAHEMGHSITAKTDIGAKIQDIKHKIAANPKLGTAIAAASGLVPMGVAMATPGDDEYTTAALGNLALASPTLLNEALASKNGLALMNSGGIRASMGQRGLLAGALMSYAAVPMLLGATGTALGNQFDEDVPAQ